MHRETWKACVLPRPGRGGAHSSGLPSTIHTCLPGNGEKMGGTTDGKTDVIYLICAKFEAKGDGCDTGRHFNGVTWSMTLEYIWWQSMVEVPKFGHLQKTKQRLVVDAKGIYILHSSMMMMLHMPELPFTSAQFVPTSQSHMNVVRAHTSSPIPRRAKIRPGVPTWAR